MKNLETVAPVDFRNSERTSYSAVEWFARQRHLVLLVIAAYRGVRNLSAIVAINHDEGSRRRSNRWTVDSCHYAVDVENAVRRVVEFKPESERPSLWTAWQNLLSDDESKIGKAEQRLIKLLSGSFHIKGLHPGLYFRPRRLTPKDKSK